MVIAKQRTTLSASISQTPYVMMGRRSIGFSKYMGCVQMAPSNGGLLPVTELETLKDATPEPEFQGHSVRWITV